MAQQIINPTPTPTEVSKKSGNLSFARIFGYMGIGIFITAVISLLLSWVFSTYVKNINTISIICIVAAVIQLIVSLVITFISLKRTSILVPAIIYSVTIGFLFGSLFSLINLRLGNSKGWAIIGGSFGVTAGTFLLMALIGYFSKGNLSGLAIAGLGLLGGACLLALFNLIFMWLNPGVSVVLYWIISFAVFGALMLITIFDIWNIKKITDRGAVDQNMEFYCAFTIYNDFIAIFIRILYYALIFFGNSK